LAKKEVYLVGIQENQLKADMLEIEATLKLLNKNICDWKLIGDFGLDVDKVGNEVASLENKMFVNKDEYYSLKRFYYALEIEHYFLLKDAEKKCDRHFIFIFYFYKNINECGKCYSEGVYLTVLKEKYPNLVQVYSFNMKDYNKSILLKKLMLKYNINPNETAPVLIINDKKYSYLTLEQLENLTLNFIRKYNIPLKEIQEKVKRDY